MSKDAKQIGKSKSKSKSKEIERQVRITRDRAAILLAKSVGLMHRLPQPVALDTVDAIVDAVIAQLDQRESSKQKPMGYGITC